jgi:hypothetical protein
MPALFCVSSQGRATKSCPKLFCSFDLLGGWVRFAKTTALIILELDCTQENDAQPGVSIDHFMPLVGSPPARNTTFDGEIRPIDPARATRITVASFGAFLIVPNVAAKLRDGRSALCSRTARAHDPISYASTFARSELNKDAALAHLWFVTVHPFDDGNGRIARAIADLALARSEQSPKRFYSMSAQIRLERNDYYGILAQIQKDTLDVTAWMRWFLGCLDRAFDGAELTLASVLRKARFWEVHAWESLNDRQRKIVNRLLNGFEGKLTSSKWAKLAKCSQDTAHRDILDLVKRGILAKDEAGGRSTSYSLTEL